MIDIRDARVPDDLDTVRSLFRAYADGLGIDLGFQDFDAELAALPGKYAPPSGRLLLAWTGGEATAEAAVGCVAMRPLDATTCEMKRLYVAPSMRGSGLGARLAMRICDEARTASYRCMRLDTLPTMTAAIALYRTLGFTPIDAYVYNPIPGAIYLERDLRLRPSGATSTRRS